MRRSNSGPGEWKKGSNMARGQKFVVRLMASVATAAIGMGGFQALAQGVAATEIETVVVTGSRDVVTSPDQIKRMNVAIVDSITANELDKLTDQTLPEALDRIPGVSSDIGYQTSQAQYATVRGFDSRYNSAEVDGNPIWNSSRNNRGAQLDIFPTGAVSQINVYKTVTPDQDANSIGGHIELRTLRAFDGGGGAFFSARAELGTYEQGRLENPGNPSFFVSAVGKNTFGSENQYGFVVGAGAQRQSWYDKYNTVTAYSQINNNDVVNGSIFPGSYDDTYNRYSAYAKLEAHASDKFYAFLSAAWYQTLVNNQEFRTGPFLTAKNVTSQVQNTGSFTNVPEEAYLETYSFKRGEALIGSGLDYRVSDKDQVKVRLGYTYYSDYENDATGERFEAPTVTGSYNLSNEDPTITLNPNAALGNPANWVLRNTKASSEKILPHFDHVYSATASYNSNNFDTAEGLGFSAGGGFRRLVRNFDQHSNNYLLPKNPALTLGQFLPSGTVLDGVTPPIFDPNAFWGYIKANGILTVDPAPSADYHLQEDVYSGYADLVYNWEGLHALAGVRFESTQSVDRTSNAQGAAFVPQTFRIHYTNVLPNVQLSYDATENVKLRAAYTDAIARPDFKDYAMGQTVSLDGNGFPVIAGTNPYLQPRLSHNYDLSAEYYEKEFYGSIGLFHKTIARDEFSQKFQQTNAAGIVILTQTIPLNTGKAYLDGFELNFVQKHMSWLPEPLDNLSFNGNFTRLIGEWDVALSDGTPRKVGGLRNQPRWLANLGVGYTWGPVDLNLAVRFRGHTFTGTFGVNSFGDVWINPYTRLDLQASYLITPEFKAFFDARNLNNAWWSQTTGQQGSLNAALNPGRSFLIGVKWKP